MSAQKLSLVMYPERVSPALDELFHNSTLKYWQVMQKICYSPDLIIMLYMWQTGAAHHALNCISLSKSFQDHCGLLNPVSLYLSGLNDMSNANKSDFRYCPKWHNQSIFIFKVMVIIAFMIDRSCTRGTSIRPVIYEH